MIKSVDKLIRVFPGGRMDRTLKLFWLVVLTAFTINACRNLPNEYPVSLKFHLANECQIISHEMGQTKVCGKPQKIVALGPSILELLLSLDIQPVGFADHILFHRGDYNNPSQQIPYLGDLMTNQPVNLGLAYSPSIEVLLKVKPDLIIGTVESNRTQYESLTKIAPTLLFKWFDSKSNLQTIAKVMGYPEKAEQLFAESEHKIANARQKLSAAIASRPRMLMLLSGAQRMQNLLLVTSRNSFCGSLVADLGFQLVYPASMGQTNQSVRPPISIEILPQLNDADLIILLGRNFGQMNKLMGMQNFQEHQLQDFQQQWQNNAIAQSMTASKAGRVYFIPAYLCLGLPGPIGTELYLKELQKQLLVVP